MNESEELKEDDRRFRMWFRVNENDPFATPLLTTQEYWDLKHNDNKVLEYVLKRISEPIENLWKSVDDVDYTVVELPYDEPVDGNPTENLTLHNLTSENLITENTTENPIDVNASSCPDVTPVNVASSNSQSASKTKSEVWKWFKKESSRAAKCTICLKTFQSSGNTTNLRRHLTFKHKTIIDITDEPPAKRTKKTLIRIPEMFQRVADHSDGGAKAEKITNNILYMIAVDTLPLSTVEKPGFKQLMKSIVPLYVVPSRKTVTSLMTTKYQGLKEIFIKKLEAIPFYCLTCDIWTDISNSSYLGVTIHYLPENETSLISQFLTLYPLHENHTAAYITQSLMSVMDSFNLKNDKITAVISDSAANMKKAIKDGFGSNRVLSCFAHILSNLVPAIVKMIPSVSEIINKVKNIVVCTKRSVIATDTLKKLQIMDGKTEGTVLKFTQNVETRWNSTFYMIERFLVLQDYVYPVILKCKNPPKMLTQNEIIILKDLVDLMKPIENVITEISADKYPTCSMMIPIMRCVKKSIERIHPETEVGKKFKYQLTQEISSKFIDVEKNYLLALSTIFDPRYKQLHFEDKVALSTAYKYIDSMIKKNQEQTITEKKKTVNSNSSTDLWAFHDEIAIQNHQDIHSTEGLSCELLQYLNQPVIDRSENAIRYWKTYKNTYPSLTNVALKYLCIVCTSVPAERLFSKAGSIKTNDRNRLTGKNLADLLFLSSCSAEEWNLDFLNV